jgi:hypothetical protein
MSVLSLSLWSQRLSVCLLQAFSEVLLLRVAVQQSLLFSLHLRDILPSLSF